VSERQHAEEGTRPSHARPAAEPERSPAPAPQPHPATLVGAAPPGGLAPRQVLRLQRAVGNRATALLLGAAPAPKLQARLFVGPAGDAFEQEADRVAREVLSALDAPAGGKAGAEASAGAEVPAGGAGAGVSVRRQERAGAATAVEGGGGGGEVSQDVGAEIEGARGGGRALGEGLRASMEQAFGHDFGGVRLHTDARAEALNNSLGARAFTAGQDIFFGPGEFDAGTSAGRELLAHELAHVVQQGGAVRRQADAAGVAGAPATVQGAGALSGQAPGRGGVLRLKKKTHVTTNDDDKDHVNAFIGELEKSVTQSWAIVVSRPLTPVESKLDGYTERWADQWAEYQKGDTSVGSMVPAMVGYAIESLATKLFRPPDPGGGLSLQLQATRGKTRPDVVLKKNNVDVAWLDITSSLSVDHIKNKEGGGWATKPHVAEILYDAVSAQSIKENQERYAQAPWDLADTGAMAENYLRNRAKFEAQKEVWVESVRKSLEHVGVLGIGSYSQRKTLTTQTMEALLNVTDLQPTHVGAILTMAGLNPTTYGFRKKSPTGVGYVSQWSKPLLTSEATALFQEFATLPEPDPNRVVEWYNYLKG